MSVYVQVSEAVLAGALRRERAAEEVINEQAAEIEQLNRLVIKKFYVLIPVYTSSCTPIPDCCVLFFRSPILVMNIMDGFHTCPYSVL
jgi:hypothetical protein